MGITKIHAIKTTPQLALRYAMSDKGKEYNSEDDISRDTPHEIIVDEETGAMYVHYFTQSSFLNCSPLNPYQAFAERQAEFQGKLQNSAKRNKDGKEPLMYHLVQSFEGWEVDSRTANEIGLKLAEEMFGDYICVISTHGNTDDVHNHIIISAWNSEGRKLNDDLALVNNIRKVSDRLCEEYGLTVLENTRTMKLTTYKDKDGKTHKVEMTDRKKAIMQERDEGFTVADDVGSYRHTEAYSESERIKKSNIQDIKNDIDMLLPKVASYEQLLDEMRNLGYEIRDRKKNGEWLAYVSFKAPTHDKATRDKSLDKNGFYLRINLTDYIRRLNEKRREEEKQKEQEEQYHRQRIDDKEEETEELPVIEYFDKYEHGKTDISKVNEKYRAVKDKRTGNIVTVRRTPFEERAVVDLKKCYDTLDNDKRVHHITRANQKLTQAQKAELIDRIVHTWETLSYVEQNNLYTYNQMLDLYRKYKSEYDTAVTTFTTIEKTLSDLSVLKKNCDRVDELNERMVKNKGNIAYALSMYPDDKREYDTCIRKLEIHNLGTIEERREFFGRIEKIQQEQNDVRSSMAIAIHQMNELENCIHTLSRIDREAGLSTENVEERLSTIRETDKNIDRKKNRDRSD